MWTSNLAGRGWICLALGLITLAVFWPSLTHDFLSYDDQAYVTENPPVRAGLSWPGVVWAFESFSVANWHPLTWLSHMLDCQLYGLKPAGHHLTSLLLHTATASTSAQYLHRVFRRRPYPAFLGEQRRIGSAFRRIRHLSVRKQRVGSQDGVQEDFRVRQGGCGS